jgi:predicted esterase
MPSPESVLSRVRFCVVLTCVVCCSLAKGQSAPGSDKPVAALIDPAKTNSSSVRAAPYRLPVRGIEISVEARQALERKFDAVAIAAQPLAGDPLFPDVSVLLKAVRYALTDGEFYGPKDTEKADELLALAQTRVAELKEHRPTWLKQTGTLARGFVSAIDGSAQPIGLEIPSDLDWTKPVPLTVWLHGRGDKATDMHFIAERLHKPGQFQPGVGIILHPFGRQCLGYQLAGETDVIEAIEAVKRMYHIDAKRILLAGFSMGGAGAWHLGAHYADHWCGLHAGAGFVEVKRFMKMTPETLPPTYIQMLWGQYDVPDYVRNLFNLPVLAYSGEMDGQKLAADIMAESFQAEGRTLQHLVGPGMGHQYHPERLKDIEAWARERLLQGQSNAPAAVHWQGRTLKYPRMFWLTVTGLKQHWVDSRADGEWVGARLKLTTHNVTRLEINLDRFPQDRPANLEVDIDGQTVNSSSGDLQNHAALSLELAGDSWRFADPSNRTAPQKVPNLQGPIDDAFMEPFVVVPPDRPSGSSTREGFYQRELEFTARRWRQVFRGDLPIRKVSELTSDILESKNLVLFGDPECNSLVAELLPQTPLNWKGTEIKLGTNSWHSDSLVPVLIYPNPKHPHRYLVLNSGPTIREKSDPNNSLQTPQLPDWAILDTSTPPNETSAGKILDIGFFNESWGPQLKASYSW